MFKESIVGKKILITGSTDGLGKLLALRLANEGAEVLLHGRNPEKGRVVREEIYRQTRNEKIQYYNGDFSSLKEVKALAEQLLHKQDHLDILINNVGIGKGVNNQREVSEDGLELRFAVNYLSHVLLTERLLPLLVPNLSIIVNVASVGQEPIDFDNLMLEMGYDGLLAYRRSKTAMIMYSYDLADQIRESGILVNAIHPASLMNTKMVLKEMGYSLTTVEQGADAVENVLAEKSTGSYYDGKHLSRSISQTYDQAARVRLRKITFNLLENYLGIEKLVLGIGE